MINIVTTFLAKDTVQVKAYIYTQAEGVDDALVDPTAVTIDIYNPAGTKLVNAVAMTKEDTGIYYYQYHTGTSTAAMAKGNWKGVVTAVDGTGSSAIISTGSFTFKVV